MEMVSTRENNNNEIAIEEEQGKGYTKKFIQNHALGIIHEPIIVAAFCTFSTYILQSGMETLITPFTHWYFNWDAQTNAVLYMCVGTISTIGYLR